MLSREYVYAYAAVSVSNGKLDTLILPTVNTACMQIFLEEVASRYPEESIVIVLDCAGWHRSTTLKVPSNIVLIHLPPYSPELNPVEHLWDDYGVLKRFFATGAWLEFETDYLEEAATYNTFYWRSGRGSNPRPPA